MNNISILIVEDEPALLNRLAVYLSIFCDTVYTATDGKEGLEVYKKHLPNIILSDINMPKLTGIKFIQEVRKVDKNIQIIVLSAHTKTEDFLKVVPLNLVSYLVKPIQMEQLKTFILEAIQNISKFHLDDTYIHLNDEYSWNKQTKCLYIKKELVNLTSYEKDFLEILIMKLNQKVSYEEIHNYIYVLQEYSQNAIFTIVKRIRKKTKKDFIKSCFKFGYTIESE